MIAPILTLALASGSRPAPLPSVPAPTLHHVVHVHRVPLRAGAGRLLLDFAVELPAGGVLAGVRLLVVEEFDKVEVTRGDESAEEGADPVDPVVGVEVAADDGGAEGAGGVEGGAGLWGVGLVGCFWEGRGFLWCVGWVFWGGGLT